MLCLRWRDIPRFHDIQWVVARKLSRLVGPPKHRYGKAAEAEKMRISETLNTLYSPHRPCGTHSEDENHVSSTSSS